MFLKLVQGIAIVLLGVITITIGFLPLIKRDITEYNLISAFTITPDKLSKQVLGKQESMYTMPYIFTKKKAVPQTLPAKCNIISDDNRLIKIANDSCGIILQKLLGDDYHLTLYATIKRNSDSVIIFDVPSIKDFKKYFEKVSDITQKSQLVASGITPESWQCIGVRSIGSIGIVERFQSGELLDTCCKKFAVNMQNQNWLLVEKLKDGYVFRKEGNLCTFRAIYNSKKNKTEIIVVTSNRGIGG